jgi:hypothetical protein
MVEGVCLNILTNILFANDGTQQIIGRERRERVSHHDWSGNA